MRQQLLRSLQGARSTRWPNDHGSPDWQTGPLVRRRRRKLSEFVVASAQDAARRVIAENEPIRLSREGQRAFVQALLQGREPNARLERAAKAYRQRTGS